MSDLSQFTYRQLSRAKNICSHAIGSTMKIRTSKNTFTTGTIKTAEPSYTKFSRTGRTWTLVFRVILECGKNKVEKEFFICRLPRS